MFPVRYGQKQLLHHILGYSLLMVVFDSMHDAFLCVVLMRMVLESYETRSMQGVMLT